MHFFAFDALPIELQHRLNAGEMISIIKEDKPFAIISQNKPSYAKGDFDYDLERMKKAVKSPFIRAPKLDTPEALLEWMDNLTDADFEREQV